MLLAATSPSIGLAGIRQVIALIGLCQLHLRIGSLHKSRHKLDPHPESVKSNYQSSSTAIIATVNFARASEVVTMEGFQVC